MKKTALVRKTPLSPGRPNRRWVRADADKVTPELAAYIFDRDKMCLAARLDPEHRCRNRWGDFHAADDRRHLRIAHVKTQARAGVRAESTRWHLVVECDFANNEGWSSANRDRERTYIASVEPE